jgi:predicted metal-dependent hydrolase
MFSDSGWSADESRRVIPLHDDELALQRRVHVRERHVRQARTAMQKEQERLDAIVAADENPLLHATKRHFLQ